jgi:hypothetical protein
VERALGIGDLDTNNELVHTFELYLFETGSKQLQLLAILLDCSRQFMEFRGSFRVPSPTPIPTVQLNSLF